MTEHNDADELWTDAFDAGDRLRAVFTDGREMELTGDAMTHGGHVDRLEDDDGTRYKLRFDTLLTIGNDVIGDVSHFERVDDDAEVMADGGTDVYDRMSYDVRSDGFDDGDRVTLVYESPYSGTDVNVQGTARDVGATSFTLELDDGREWGVFGRSIRTTVNSRRQNGQVDAKNGRTVGYVQELSFEAEEPEIVTDGGQELADEPTREIDTYRKRDSEMLAFDVREMLKDHDEVKVWSDGEELLGTAESRSAVWELEDGNRGVMIDGEHVRPEDVVELQGFTYADPDDAETDSEPKLVVNDPTSRREATAAFTAMDAGAYDHWAVDLWDETYEPETFRIGPDGYASLSFADDDERSHITAHYDEIERIAWYR